MGHWKRSGQDDSVAKRSAEPDTEIFPWIPESEDDDDENNVASNRSREEDTQESFPWIPESEEENDDEAEGAS